MALVSHDNNSWDPLYCKHSIESVITRLPKNSSEQYPLLSFTKILIVLLWQYWESIINNWEFLIIYPADSLLKQSILFSPFRHFANLSRFLAVGDLEYIQAMFQFAMLIFYKDKCKSVHAFYHYIFTYVAFMWNSVSNLFCLRWRGRTWILKYVCIYTDISWCISFSSWSF